MRRMATGLLMAVVAAGVIVATSTRTEALHLKSPIITQVTDTKIVQTFSFDEMPDAIALETMWFEDLGDGMTRLHAQSLCDSIEGRDGMLSSGMDTGVHEGYAKLDGLLADGAV